MRTYTLDPHHTFRSTAAPASARPAQPAAPAPARRPVSRPNPPGPLGGVLSKKQKAALVLLAREAFEAQGRPGKFDDWRHAECQRACGKPGLTAAVADDYNLLQAHFLMLKGEAGRALNAHLRHGTEAARVARHKLTEALAKARLPEAYATAIARRQYRATLDELSPKQLWALVYTVNNRGTTKRRAATPTTEPF